MYTGTLDSYYFSGFRNSYKFVPECSVNVKYMKYSDIHTLIQENFPSELMLGGMGNSILVFDLTLTSWYTGILKCVR